MVQIISNGFLNGPPRGGGKPIRMWMEVVKIYLQTCNLFDDDDTIDYLSTNILQGKSPMCVLWKSYHLGNDLLFLRIFLIVYFINIIGLKHVSK